MSHKYKMFLNLCCYGFSDLLSDDTSYKMEVKMNPDGGLHIPGLSYVTVSSVQDVNLVRILAGWLAGWMD